MRLVLLVVVLVACGGQASAPPPDPTPGPTRPSDAAPGSEDTITGTLGGDPDLEGGCGWLDAGGTRWQVQYPQGWELSLDPVQLTGPDGETAEEGDTITVAGAEQPDVMTTCQVGPVWAATSVTVDG